MATKISTEILIKILKNVKSSRSTQNLYSSLLVNRIWCKVTIPILWELTLGQEIWMGYEVEKKSLCIRTYISCMKTQARTSLIQNGFDLSESIISILELPGAPKVFKKLESFTSKIENICPLYKSIALNCDNILNLDLFVSDSHVILSAKLISVQKLLENLSIVVVNKHLDCNSLFWAIISQKDTLKSLRLHYLNLNHVEWNSSLIGQFISLQELYIEDCSGFHKSDYLFLASSFTQLSNFRYIHSESAVQEYSQEFIIKILETANINLKNIYLDLYPEFTFDIISAILNYCTRITESSLNSLNSEQVIKIFNHNFNELRRFPFYCEIEGFDADELLCKMAKNVPESLETIEIIMGYENPWMISASSLRKFFRGWCYKGLDRNKNVIARYTGSLPFTLSDEHFKVIEEYGVQFDIE
ncbi:7841_t:CDS:2 [Diversispora eburnea]|uniref:7841_t:CDS:1 n=1 Tax=Diversispora eburnea TaxID=1213867 RepID=A0A9N9FHW6_9GLOM|nr:7841_t:CDS:2 [Diversispora eburnea]